jgi:8-oxo-dGTP pyrophosphatase MutT (NUDIX family)
MTKMRDARILSTELLVDSFKKVVKEELEFEAGDVQDWIYIDSPKSVMVAALTPDKELVLVRLYRHNIKQDVYELPAGGAEHEGETTLEAAKRELLEETGYKSDKFVDLGRYYVSPSETNRWAHYFLALDAIKTQEPELDDTNEKYLEMSVTHVAISSLRTVKDSTEAGITGVESLHGLNLVRDYLDTNGDQA